MPVSVVEKKIRYYKQLRELELIAAEIYPQDSSRLVLLRKSHEPVRFAPGFATCRAWGVTYHFHTTAQRNICRELWKAWEGKTGYQATIDHRTLMLRAGLDGKFSSYWRGKKEHPALGVLIHHNAEVVWMGEEE